MGGEIVDPDDPIAECPLYKEFESRFEGFRSLRANIYEKRRKWLLSLSQDNFEITDDPDSFFIPFDAYRSVLNEDLEVSIGDSIIKYINEDIYVEIKKNNTELLEQFRDQNPIAFISQDVTVHQLSLAAGCVYFTANINGLFVGFSPQITSGTGCSYSWDFGDGTTSQSEAPQHTYASPGTYIVRLLINCFNGCSDSFSLSVSVGVQDPCTANPIIADFDFSVGSNNIVTFTSTSTGNPSNYLWEFGENNDTDSGPNTDGTVHQYQNPGTYSVCLTITRSDGCSDSICKDVEIEKSLCCDDSRLSDPRTHHYESGKSMHYKIWRHNMVAWHKVGAKTENFEWRSGGLNGAHAWRKTKTNIMVKMKGDVWLEQPFVGRCGRKKEVDEFKGHANKHTREVMKGFGDPLSTRRESITSEHYCGSSANQKKIVITPPCD